MAGMFMRFPQGKAKALTLSYDDGVEQDIRLIDIMNHHGLKGTFNLNSGEYASEGTLYPKGHIHRRMTKDQATALYTDCGNEVAVHGLTHPFLEQLPENMVMWEVMKDRNNLETQFHTIIRGMAYPFGTYNDMVVGCLEKAGIVYARTVISNHNFKLPQDWLRLETTCHHNDPELMPLSKKFVEQAPQREAWLFYLWGHSYEFDKHDNWQVIEEFAAYVGDREDIWYATNIQIYDYVQAFGRLEFSADGMQVFNPTFMDLYFKKDEKLYCVSPGEKLDII